jgi:hypothetical protein
VPRIKRRRFLLAGAGTILMGCAPQAQRWGDGLTPLYAQPGPNEWPVEMEQVSVEIRDLYRYAAANEATLKWFLCYCGCVEGGHRSNFDCYVREVLPDGRVRLDTMSFG